MRSLVVFARNLVLHLCIFYIDLRIIQSYTFSMSIIRERVYMSTDKSMLCRQIADRTGLSVSSVSKILNGASGYSVTTRRRVEALASELAAGQPSPQNRDVLKIGVMIPEHPAYFWGEAILGIRQTIRSIQAECERQVEPVLRFVHAIVPSGAALQCLHSVPHRQSGIPCIL